MKLKPKLKLLRKLGNHLIEGKLAHDKFDFGTWNARYFWDDKKEESIEKLSSNPKYAKRNCGYAGCAIGELPAISKQFSWHKQADRVFFEDAGEVVDFPEKSLGLSRSIFEHLFVPGEQINGRHLGVPSTAKKVGNHILNWCNEYEAGLWDEYFN